MPNHVINKICMQGDPKEIQSMLEQIKNDDFGIGTVDFDKIIPMPKSLDIESGTRTENGLKAYRQFIELYISGKTAEHALESLRSIPAKNEEAFLKQRPEISREEWELGKVAWHNLQNYGVATWYDWCIGNWATKWNAYGYEKGVDYSGNDNLCFRTAWSAPHPVLDKLSEMYPEIVMEHRWADEDIGCNCGQRTRLGGKIIDEYIPEGVRAKDFAMEMWGYVYLHDRMDSEKKAWPGLNTIAKDLSVSRSTVKRAVKDLEKTGLIRKEPHFRENGSATSNRYYLL